MQRLQNPIPLFPDGRGSLLDAGYIYVGEAFADPEVSPVNLFTDAELTQPIEQPLRTLGGAIVKNANRVLIYYADADVSVRVRDVNGQLVDYVASVAAVTADLPTYQPVDADLTAIAALATTAYGRALLTLANQTALKAAVGIPDSLPLTGGAVTGNIVRSGKGVHLYHNDPAMTGGRVFVRPATDPDPTSLPGDVWLKY